MYWAYVILQNAHSRRVPGVWIIISGGESLNNIQWHCHFRRSFNCQLYQAFCSSKLLELFKADYSLLRQEFKRSGICSVRPIWRATGDARLSRVGFKQRELMQYS